MIFLLLFWSVAYTQLVVHGVIDRQLGLRTIFQHDLWQNLLLLFWSIAYSQLVVHGVIDRQLGPRTICQHDL